MRKKPETTPAEGQRRSPGYWMERMPLDHRRFDYTDPVPLVPFEAPLDRYLETPDLPPLGKESYEHLVPYSDPQPRGYKPTGPQNISHADDQGVSDFLSAIRESSRAFREMDNEGVRDYLFESYRQYSPQATPEDFEGVLKRHAAEFFDRPQMSEEQIKTDNFFESLRLSSPHFRDLPDQEIFGLLFDSFVQDNPGVGMPEFRAYFQELVENYAGHVHH